MLTEDSTMIIDPPSPIERHVKWKLTRTKRYGQMTFKATQEISNKIVSSLTTSHVIYIITSFDQCTCLVCYRTRYKNRQPRAALFPMVVRIYLVLPLGD